MREEGRSGSIEKGSQLFSFYILSSTILFPLFREKGKRNYKKKGRASLPNLPHQKKGMEGGGRGWDKGREGREFSKKKVYIISEKGKYQQVPKRVANCKTQCKF